MDVVGCKVELKTKAGEVHSGIVWAYDKALGIVTLQCPSTSGAPDTSNVVVLRSAHVAELVSAEAPEDDTWRPEVKPVDQQKLAARERRAVQAMEKSIRAVGKGVTAEAQRIFDALERTMPCEWRAQSIRVYDAVEVVPPYGLADCAFLPDATRNPMVLERVQTVLRNERERISGGGGSEGAAGAATPEQ